MKIPSRVTIGGQVYRVVQKKPESGSDWMGLTDFNNNLIWIDKSMTHQAKESTFLHEIIEVINYQYEMRLPHNYIMTLETALYQVLKDNKLVR